MLDPRLIPERLSQITSLSISDRGDYNRNKLRNEKITDRARFTPRLFRHSFGDKKNVEIRLKWATFRDGKLNCSQMEWN